MRSGLRTKIESIREFIYPTEYDPPCMPQKLTGPIDPGTKITTPTNPTAFEMRPVGMTLDVEPTLRTDEQHIDLSITPEQVEFHGYTVWGAKDSITPMPIYHRLKTNTNNTVRAGGTELLGIHTPSSGDKKVLSFVTAIKLAVASQSDFETFKAAPEKWMLEIEEAKIRAVFRKPPDPFDEVPENAERKAPRLISILTEYIEVDATMASRYARQINECADATQIRLQLDAVVESGEATLLESKMILTRSGQKSKSESIREFSYPTEYDPPEVPSKLQGPIDRDIKITKRSNPNAFEMRPTGVTVEMDPVMNWEGSLIDIKIAPEMVRFSKMLVHGQGDSEAKQPLFESIKLSSSVSMAEGTTLLLGIHSLETARAGEAAKKTEQDAVRGRRILVFLTTTVKALN